MRETLSSRLGFLMLAAGCAVGLGNVWRFPYIVGRNGGAAFVILYLVFLALLGFPMLVAELAVGRGSRCGVTGAFAALAPRGCSRRWRIVGPVLFVGNLLLMIYYTDVAGWLVKYTADYVTGRPPSDPGAAFAALAGTPRVSGLFMSVVVALATLTCLAGVAKGVERVTKAMMISLLALLTVLAVKAVSLPGAEAGVSFYLKPDWSRFLADPGRVLVDAMGQAFFTLSIGIGAMTIFGSYVDRRHSLVTEACWIVAIDTFVALLAGLVVFPACAAYGVDYTGGPGLIFVALPGVFNRMAGGAVWGSAFFLFLSFAALTTVIAVFECLIGGLRDMTAVTRLRASLAVGAAVALASLPCVLFDGVLDWEDFVVSRLWLPLGALVFCIFVTRRQIGWGWEGFYAEASAGDGMAFPRWMRAHLTWVVPVMIVVLFVAGLVEKFAS